MERRTLERLNLKVKLKPILQKEMGFCYLWFCLKRSSPQAGYQGGGHESRTRNTELEG